MYITEILDAFPKKRPPISGEMQKIYSIEYKRNRSGKSPLSFLAQKLEGWMHKKVAQAYNKRNLPSCDTLEIGAGTLNQLAYETESRNFDFIEPLKFLYLDSQYLPLTRERFADIADIDTNTKYDRIISVAVLEHVEDLPQLLRKSAQHLVEGGIFACGIPSEGGFLWGLAWRLTTGLEYRLRTGLSYSHLMRHEHLNEAWEIEKLLQHFFKKVKIHRLGIGRHFSLYTYIECKEPK